MTNTKIYTNGVGNRMAAHEHINQDQLRSLIAGDFYMAGTPDDEQIKVGQLHPDDVTTYSWDKDHYEGLTTVGIETSPDQIYCWSEEHWT